jgi:hypothetical protein
MSMSRKERAAYAAWKRACAAVQEEEAQKVGDCGTLIGLIAVTVVLVLALMAGGARAAQAESGLLSIDAQAQEQQPIDPETPAHACDTRCFQAVHHKCRIVVTNWDKRAYQACLKEHGGI